MKKWQGNHSVLRVFARQFLKVQRTAVCMRSRYLPKPRGLNALGSRTLRQSIDKHNHLTLTCTAAGAIGCRWQRLDVGTIENPTISVHDCNNHWEIILTLANGNYVVVDVYDQAWSTACAAFHRNAQYT